MSARTIHLAVSPCPNDTFIFHGLLNGLVDVTPYRLETTLADVEELNAGAVAGRFDVVKISVAAFPAVAHSYRLLSTGGALGRGCGPLLVARPGTRLEAVSQAPVAIPGARTTANLLLSLHGSLQGPRRAMRFDAVMPAVARGEAAVGLVIHEGRFTYPQYGLEPLLDLGAWWEASTGLPIPLGAIAARRELGRDTALFFEQAIGRSLALAHADPEGAWPYIQAHAGELDTAAIRQHIATFVTPASAGLDAEGRQAVTRLVRAAASEAGQRLDAGSVFWE